MKNNKFEGEFFNFFLTLQYYTVLEAIGNTFIELLKDYKARYLGIGKVDPDFAVFYEEKKKKQSHN